MNIDYKKFQEICTAPWDYFANLPGAQVVGKDHKYIYFDNDSRILAVAHLDSVQTKDFHFYALEIAGTVWVFNPQLDDRIGAYAILDLLPRLGLKYDILLTTDEEIGQSTAEYFKTEKDYLWMFEVDRRGEDVVHYQYDREFLKKRLKRAGFTKVSQGAKSDISYLGFLGCCGFNVGTGYEDEHTVWAKANMDVFTRQMGRLVDFYNKFNTLYFKYDPKEDLPKKTTSYYGSNWNSPLPAGYTRVWTAGCVWDRIVGAYKLPADPAPLLVVAGDSCAHCERVFLPGERSATYPSVCKSCANWIFECIGCGELKDYKEEARLNLCTKCETEAAGCGHAKFTLKIECENEECHNFLTLKEYEDGIWCTPCNNKWYEDQHGIPF